MNRFSTYILVAAVAVSGASLAVAADTDNMGNTGTQMQQLGSQQADESTQKEVRNMLAHVVNDAAMPSKFSSVISYLSKAGRDRLADIKNAKTDDLDGAINQFRADFKNKYNQDFDLSSDQLKDAIVNAGQDKKSATVSLANPDLSNTGASASPAQLNNGTNNSASNTGANSSGQLNNSIIPPANVTLASAATLNLINEGHIMNAWRINIPDQITGEQLKQNLIKQIQMLDDQKSTWPGDVNAAYKATAYHVLQAFNDSSLASER
jgi:hypothetical protein